MTPGQIAHVAGVLLAIVAIPGLLGVGLMKLGLAVDAPLPRRTLIVPRKRPF